MNTWTTNFEFPERRPSSQSIAGFVGLALSIGGLAALLTKLVGPPGRPATPRLASIDELLSGTTLPADVVISLASGLAWLLLGYLSFSVLLRALACTLFWLRGASPLTWRLLHLSDLLTLPFVRRLTDGAVAGVALTSAWMPSLPGRQAVDHADLVALPARRVTVPSLEPPANLTGTGGKAQVQLLLAPDLLVEQEAVRYTVVAGDTLWEIARRCYGDGERHRDLFAANAGAVMANGEAFTDPDLIRRGWTLHVPLPADNISAEGGGIGYRVQPGDSLVGIAERFLGDSLRWQEVWELNRDRPMAGGRSFTNPALILPGWTLRLPVAPVVLAPAPAEPAPAAEAPPTTTPTQRVAPTAAQNPLDPTAAPGAAPTTESAESEGPGRGGRGWSVEPLAVAAGAAGLAAAGAAAVFVRRARNARPGASSRTRHAGGRRRGGRNRAVEGDAERVRLAARLLLAALAEQGFEEVRALTCRETSDDVAVLVQCPPGDERAVADARFALARRLSCAIESRLLPGQRVELTLSRLRREAAALFADAEAGESPLLIVPVGAEGETIHYLNMTALGGIHIAGSESRVSGLLSAWMTTLAASIPPDAYALACDATTAQLVRAGSARRFPYWPREETELGDALLAALEEELATRTADAATHTPTLVAILRPDAGDESGRVETLLRRGHREGIVTVIVGNEGGDDSLASGCDAGIAFAGAHSAEGAPAGTLAFTLAGSAPIALRPVLVPQGYAGPSEDRHDGPPAPASPSQDHESGVPVPHEAAADNARATVNGALKVHPESTTVLRAPVFTSAAGNGAHPEPARPAFADTSRGAAHRTAPSVEVAPVALVKVEPTTIEEREVDGDESPAPPMPVFSVRCYGAFQVEAGSRPVLNWKIQKARELLAYLVARAGAPVPREEAGEALWPEQEAGQLQRLLSDAAYHLRRALKEAAGSDVEPLVTQGQRYHLQTDLFAIDVASCRAHLGRATTLPPAEALVEYERALALYRGALFGAEPFEWAGPFRREQETMVVEAVRGAARLADDAGDPQQALRFYRAILAYDPIDEEATRNVMRCYAGLGDTNGVRKAHKALVAALRRELDDPHAEPLPETAQLLEDLLRR